MNAFIEQMNAIRDANKVLVEIVLDPDLCLQGFLIIERVQKRLIDRQVRMLLELQCKVISRFTTILPKGTIRENPVSNPE